MSSRRSAVTVKAEAARRRTYPDARQAMLAERCGCTATRPPSQAVLDEMAEREIAGGYRVTWVEQEDESRVIDRSGICSRCCVLLTASGICPLCG